MHRLLVGVWTETYHVTVTRTPDEITEEWCLDEGGEDRKYGPANMSRDVRTGVVFCEEWKRKGRLHRDDGPAYIERDRNTGRVTKSEYYKNGRQVQPFPPPRRPSGKLRSKTVHLPH